jgi:hypothetical protein
MVWELEYQKEIRVLKKQRYSFFETLGREEVGRGKI